MRQQLSALILAVVLAGCASAPPAAPAKEEPPVQQTQPAPAPTPPVQAPAKPPKTEQESPKVRDLAWAPDSRRLALLSEAGLSVMDVATKAIEQWPITVSKEMRLVGWRFDGKAVYLQTEKNALLEVDAAGKTRELAKEAPYPGGEYVSFIPSPGADLVVRQWVGPITGKFQILGSKLAYEGRFSGWSPTGRHFAYNEGGVTYLVETATGKAAQIPEPPNWHPSGEKYVAKDQVFSLDGTPLAKLPPVTRVRQWSANGSRLVFSDQEGLWTINADGTNKQLLCKCDLAGYQGAFAWLAHDEILYDVVAKSGGGGTQFNLMHISGGKANEFTSGMRSLRVSLDRSRIAYVVGPPADEVEGTLWIYPR